MSKIDYRGKEWWGGIKSFKHYRKFDGDLPQFWEMKYADLWEEIVKYVGDQPELLEIGCGTGRAGAYFQSFGAKVLGVEPGVWPAKQARKRGLAVINEEFEKAFLEGKFDVIYIEQVLSHIPDFMGTLKKARTLIKEEGLLIVEEPNDNNPLQRLLTKSHGKYWVCKDHCNYFNFASMASNLTKAGFSAINLSSTYPMELFALAGLPYLSNAKLGKKCHKMRFELEKGLGKELRKRLHEAFAELGLGRDLVITAVPEQAI